MFGAPDGVVQQVSPNRPQAAPQGTAHDSCLSKTLPAKVTETKLLESNSTWIQNSIARILGLVWSLLMGIDAKGIGRIRRNISEI